MKGHAGEGNMTLLNRLCKPMPTAQDLRDVQRRHAELRVVIEGYIAGSVSKEVFLQARREINDLAFIVRQVADRASKPRLVVV